MTFHRGPAAAWAKLPANIRGAGFVAVGGFLLIIMAALVKQLGQSLPAFEVLFVRFLAGLIVLMPLVWRLGLKIVYTQKIHLHATRGFVGFIGNMFFFFALIHIPLADTVSIQFSRPLIMIVIAALFLGERAGLKRSIITLAGFGGILMITKPFHHRRQRLSSAERITPNQRSGTTQRTTESKSMKLECASSPLDLVTKEPTHVAHADR